MKKVWTILGCFFAFCQASAQQAPARVILVGVIHKNTFLLRTDSMLRILRALQPRMILNELDTLMGFFKPGYVLVEPPQVYEEIQKRGMAKDLPPEIAATYLYRRSNPQVVIRPFDMAIPDRSNYGLRLSAIELSLQQTAYELNLHNLTKPHRQIQQRYLYLVEQYKKLYTLGYHALNQPAVTNNIREMMQIEATQLPTIVDSLADFENMKELYRERQNFWDVRNKTMADNIVHFVSQYPGTTIVVLTGILHKYYLQDLLCRQQQLHNFVLQEYYDTNQ